MFEVKVNRTRLEAAASMVSVIYHATVYDLRKSHPNAIVGLLINILQSLLMVAIFFVMISVFGLRTSAIRGDFLLYIMSGIFIFMTNIKTMKSVATAAGATSTMMLHGPMNTLVSITAAALGALYLQTLSIVVVLTIYSLAFKPVEIYDPGGAFMMLLLGWFNGVSVGIVFMALKPWFPRFTQVATTLYMRVNMFASGKMFVANTLPFFMLALFSWNPLFHIIDQARGYAFINYVPHYTSWQYALIVSIVLAFLGLLGDSYGRRYVSASWEARR
ncbi:ABC-type polysaccharide/polyol phosphate export permease [Aliiroseovarius sediminilitoris]|uniref:ABC-type polysaccharide/polyol phosphate export permease n=1 Tax=Aliiroseovarius sediminilitoris TaxID=1173584 RepID=A0A1I0MQI9_9RHOB|nr:ABC transporter permease [Aliiroseovarius sediminilitoris]SEV90836.1 ABC-type polysaccharide/polyol phosphate export permease [Aliiroseovarius sediminilitoris]